MCRRVAPAKATASRRTGTPRRVIRGIRVLGWVELLNVWARPSIGVVGRADPGENRPWNRGRSHRVTARLVGRS
jgi:hypothetical protein